MFERQFEGAEVLDALLDLAGSRIDSQEVLARFVATHEDGGTAADAIPTLFDGEPRFPSPDVARRLYQNLLGLWDLVADGRKIDLDPTAKRTKREKRRKPTPPPAFDPAAGPDADWVESAWRYLEDVADGDPRTLERLNHAFENRQDALLQWLDERGLSDDGYAEGRYLLFELFAMLTLGWPSGVSAVARQSLEAAPEESSGDVPPALRAYADEALFESELDDPKVSSAVYRGLHALWQARTR